MSAPYEILIGPLEVWLAPVGTTFPVVNAAPNASWLKMGNNDMEEAGVTVDHHQTIVEWRGLGGTGPRKVGRTQEGLKILFTLVDLTLEKYSYVTGNAIIVAAGPPATKDVPLYQGVNVNLYALVARGVAPYGDAWNVQYQIPIVYMSGMPKPVFVKGKPAGLAFEFTAVEDPNAVTTNERFGDLIAQYQ